MPKFCFLGSQVALVGLLRDDLDGNALHDLQPISVDADDFARVVRHEPDVAKTKIHKDLSAYPVIAQVGFEPQLQVSFDGITPRVLQLIGFDLVQQSDPAALLVEVEQHTAPFLVDHLHRPVELIPAVTTKGTKHIGRQAARVHSHEGRLRVIDVTLDQRDVRAIIHLVLKHHGLKLAEDGGQGSACHSLDEGFTLQTVFDQGLDGDHFEPVLLGEFR